MNQKLLSGLTAALLVSTLGAAPSGYADPAKTTGDQSGLSNALEGDTKAQSGAETTQQMNQAASNSGTTSGSTVKPASTLGNPSQVGTPAGAASPAQPEARPSSTRPASAPTDQAAVPPNAQPAEVVKVGAYQSQAPRVDTIATVESHALQGRQATTLYVRNIPVLTFLGSSLAAAASAEAAPQASFQSGAASGPEVKIASVQPSSREAAALLSSRQSPAEPDRQPDATKTRDPLWRATSAAAQLNQLHRDQVAASDIKITWDTDRRQYLVKANAVEVVAFDADTVLPDTVEGEAGDLLQATNRIRRQMGNASPLSSIEGDPNGFNQVSIGPVSLRISGYASWYGPGFEGAYSASGERFNAEALTAAHPSLPFGTQIRVTNMDNGESVVVRVNDRGPFAHGRVIDLSAGAARVIGLIQAGVAPVSLEVLGAVRSAAN